MAEVNKRQQKKARGRCKVCRSTHTTALSVVLESTGEHFCTVILRCWKCEPGGWAVRDAFEHRMRRLFNGMDFNQFLRDYLDDRRAEAEERDALAQDQNEDE